MEEDSTTWSMSPLLLLSFLPLLLFLLHHTKDKQTTRRRLPPGPPALPFLAKFLLLRQSIFELTPLLRELHARYGPLISLRLVNTVVVVSDRRLAHRVLVQGGATFAARPPMVEPDSLFSAGGRDINASPYGPYWRLVRRNLVTEARHHGLLAPARQWACDALVSSLGVSSAEAVELKPLLRRAMLKLHVYMCFGVRPGDDAVKEIVELQHRLLLLGSGFPVFSFFPAFTKLLFRKRWAENVAVRRKLDEMFVPLIHAERHHEGGPPCYADSLLALRVAGEGDRPLTDAEMVSLCFEFLSGGGDTTLILVEWIMAELVNHPDVQAKVREEVAAFPAALSDGDLQAMPYLKAVVLEGLRLHPPAHFVIPHSVQGDADIDGYTVPRGAEVNFMVAEMGRDHTAWTAPLEFRPERFLDGGEGCDVDITGSREIRMMPFGAGRRMCPAYALGMQNAAYFVARMVRDLEWRPPAGAEEVDMAEALGFFTTMKHPLRARIIPATRA